MTINKEEIKKVIPYEEPFLFVHGIEEIKDNEISGFYQTDIKDEYFKGHFRDYKIMPGALIIEAIAQLTTFLLRQKIPNHQDYHFLAYEIRGCQFYQPIFPGERIELKGELLAIYDISDYKVARCKGQALVNGNLKVEARFSVAIINKEKFREKYGR